MGNPKIRRSRWTGRGPSLDTQLNLAYLTLGQLLIYFIYGRQFELRYWWWTLAGLLTFTFFLAPVLRLGIQDWYANASMGEKLFLWILLTLTFMIPAFIRGHHIFPEGFAIMLIPIMAIAFQASMFYLYLMLCSVGFWFAMGRRPPPEFWIILAMGGAFLWSLTATHFKLIAGPYRLRGWWAGRRMLGGVVLYFIPAALSAWAAWQLWPEPREVRFVAPQLDMEKFAQAPPSAPEDLQSLLFRLGVHLLFIVASLIVLYFIRRFISRNAKAGNMPVILGAEISEMSYRGREASDRTDRLSGTRAHIMREWSRWSHKAGLVSGPRAAYETADDLRVKVDAADQPTEAREALTRLMESAHYSEMEPTPEDLRKMRRWVKADLQDLKNRSSSTGPDSES